MVVEDGTVVESGRHEELLRKGGRYASFYRLQFKGQEQPPERASLICRSDRQLMLTTDRKQEDHR